MACDLLKSKIPFAPLHLRKQLLEFGNVPLSPHFLSHFNFKPLQLIAWKTSAKDNNHSGQRGPMSRHPGSLLRSDFILVWTDPFVSYVAA